MYTADSRADIENNTEKKVVTVLMSHNTEQIRVSTMAAGEWHLKSGCQADKVIFFWALCYSTR